MNDLQPKTEDFLFMKFKTPTPTLDMVCDVYYPHLSKAKRLEKARNADFPFLCYKIDKSQKAPYLVDIHDLAIVFEKCYKAQYEDYIRATQTVLKPFQP